MEVDIKELRNSDDMKQYPNDTIFFMKETSRPKRDAKTGLVIKEDKSET